MSDRPTGVVEDLDARPRRHGLLNAVLAVLVLALLVWVLAIVARGPAAVPDAIAPAHAPTKEQADVLQYDAVKAAAREWTTDFLRVDYQDTDPIMKRVLAGTAQPFRGQYKSSEENLKQLARINRSRSQGTVLQVGVNELHGDKATLYVAANSQVSNKSTKKPQKRFYRMELTMVRRGDSWLTSELSFVG